MELTSSAKRSVGSPLSELLKHNYHAILYVAAERKCICPEPMSGSGDMTVPPEPPGGEHNMRRKNNTMSRS